MRIARVVHVFYPEAIGDPFYSQELSIRQSEAGNHITVFTWNKSSTDFFEFINPNFAVVRLPGINIAIKGMFADYPYLPSLPRFLDRERFDVLHCHSHLFLTTVQAIRKAQELARPSIVTVHGVSAMRDLFTNLAQQVFLRSFGAYVFRNATRIICLTESDAYEVARLGCSTSKIRIIPNAVDSEVFTLKGYSEDDNLVVWVGRFVAEKGLTVLIEAARIVERIKPTIKFMLVGEGPQKQEILRRVTHYGLKNIVFAGERDRKGVAAILASAAVFVFPSLKEGMPKALLEAMASGKPVVASNILGVKEIVESGYNGVLFPTGDSKSLAQAMITLIENEGLRQRLGIQARMTVLQRYTWTNTLKLLEQVYEEVLHET